MTAHVITAIVIRSTVLDTTVSIMVDVLEEGEGEVEAGTVAVGNFEQYFKTGRWFFNKRQ